MKLIATEKPESCNTCIFKKRNCEGGMTCKLTHYAVQTETEIECPLISLDEALVQRNVKLMLTIKADLEKTEFSELDKECLTTLEDFIEMVRDGGIMDYDGHGVFADVDGKYDEVVECSVHKLEAFKGVFSHVVWYNK